MRYHIVGDSHEVREDGGQFICEGFPAPEGGTCQELDVDGQNLPGYSHDSEDDNVDKKDDFSRPGLALESSHRVVETGGFIPS